MPNRVIAITKEGDDFLEKSANLPIIKYRKVLDGTATAYVCQPGLSTPDDQCGTVRAADYTT